MEETYVSPNNAAAAESSLAILENNTPAREVLRARAPLSIGAAIIDRVVELNSDAMPRKSVRQRLGSMAAQRSVRQYESESAQPVALAERPRIDEQAVITAMGRMAARRSAL